MAAVPRFHDARWPKRLVALLVLIAASAVVLAVLAQLTDFPHDSNDAQSASVNEPLRHPDRWSTWSDTAKRDLVPFMPAYVSLGVTAIVLLIVGGLLPPRRAFGLGAPMMGEVSTRTRRLCLAGAVFGFLVSAGLFSSLDNRRTWPSGVLVFATMAFGVLIHSLIRHQFMMGETVVRSRIALFGGVIGVGVGLLLWWSQAPEAANGFGFWGGVLVFIGLGLAVAEARRSKWATNRFGFGFLAAAVLLLMLPFVLMAAGVSTLVLPMLLVGSISMFVALSLLSAVCNRRLKNWPLNRAVVLWMIGAVLFGGAVAVVREATGIGGEYVLPFALALLGFMVATASRSNGDAAVVVVGIMVISTATPTPEPGPPAPSGDRPAIVALGDSFISGEGPSSTSKTRT